MDSAPSTGLYDILLSVMKKYKKLSYRCMGRIPIYQLYWVRATTHSTMKELLGDLLIIWNNLTCLSRLVTVRWERNGSVVECLTQDRGGGGGGGVAGWSLTGVTVLCP